MAASVTMMAFDHRGDQLKPLRWGLSMVIYPIQHAVDLPLRAARWAEATVASRADLLRQNAELQQRELVIQARLSKFHALEAENRRLRGLLGSSEKVAERVMIAELLAVDMHPFSRRIAINKGTRAGIVEGQPIVDADGVMGQVVHAGAYSSVALLITDPSHALPVQNNRTGLRSVAYGTGSPVLQLGYIPNNVDVRVGDLLVTSGLGGRFPSGYPVGKVTAVERESGQAFSNVSVAPSASLDRNRQVLVVWPGESSTPDETALAASEGA
jgi:rod shape-determining protein MreC